jgi:beta-lactamase regulating signal transducer with metallopeptidase domain
VESVLNWLWQGTTVAIAAAAMIRFIEPSRARIRYRALWVVLPTILVLPVIPLLWSFLGPGAVAPGPAAPHEPVVTIPAGWWTSTSLIVVAWAAWSAAHAGRVARAAFALRSAKRQCVPVPRDLETRLRHWSRLRTSGRRAHLALSAGVKAAALLGGRSPLIVLAPALVDRLTDEEIDRVVIHEWAHVQRRDDATHLLQLLVVLVAGWHPAVWWCNRQLNIEREIACDEMAVGITGSAKEYAACLTRVASVQSVSARPLRGAVALSTSGLRRRIVRILSLDRRAARPRTVSAIAAAMVIGLTAVGAGNYRAIVAGPLAIDRVPPATLAAVASSPVPLAPAIDPIERAPLPGDPAPVTEGRRSTSLRATPAQSPAPADDRSPAVVSLESPLHEPQPPPLPSRASAGVSAIDLPSGLPRPGGLAASSVDASTSTTAPPASPWEAAADAGVAVGRGTQDAAVATAGFFNRLGRKIADSF